LAQAEWPGRLEMLSLGAGQAPLLLDGAHNPAGARVLRDFLTEFCWRIPVTLLLGVMNDKPFGEMEEILLPAATRIITARVNNPRSAQAGELAERAAALGYQVEEADSVQEALRVASAVTPASGLICACGSLYLVGEIKQLLAASA
jgi:dihydrofolate synthase/folylpolyglutamate synthase